MKRLVSFVLLLVMISLTTTSFAASDYLPVSSNKAKIIIKKGEAQKVKSLSFSEPKYSFSIVDGPQFLNLIAEKEDGGVEYLHSGFKLKSSNSKVIRVESNGSVTPLSKGSVKLTASYGGVTCETKITVTGMPTGEFTIKTPAKEVITNYEFYYKENASYSTPNYQYVGIHHLKTAKVKNGLKFTGIIWAKTPVITGYITTDNKIYQIQIKKDQNKKTITLNPKSLIEVSIKTPYKNLAFTSVAVTAQDSKGVKQHSGFIHKIKSAKIYVSPGIYNLQILAKDSKNYYQFYKAKSMFKKSKENLSISAKDMALAKLSIKKSTKHKVALEYMGMNSWEHFNGISYQNLKGTSANIYLTKFSYDEMRYSLKVNEKWQYTFVKPTVRINKNLSINIGDKLKADLRINSGRTFKAGQNISLRNENSQWSDGTFSIKDPYGNKLESIRGNKENLKGYFIFRNSKDTFKVPVQSFNYINIPLPSKPGTYEVTFQIAK